MKDILSGCKNLFFKIFPCLKKKVKKEVKDYVRNVEPYIYSQEEMSLWMLINAHRISLGVNELKLLDYASHKAREHNDYMVETNTCDHTGFSNRADNIMEYWGAVKVNENVAYNYSSSSSVLNAWLRSEGHKQNIEGKFTHVGISTTINARTNKRYYTNIFVKI